MWEQPWILVLIVKAHIITAALQQRVSLHSVVKASRVYKSWRSMYMCVMTKEIRKPGQLIKMGIWMLCTFSRVLQIIISLSNIQRPMKRYACTYRDGQKRSVRPLAFTAVIMAVFTAVLTAGMFWQYFPLTMEQPCEISGRNKCFWPKISLSVLQFY